MSPRKSTAERCASSGQTQSDERAWEDGATNAHRCTRCGSLVKWRMRGTDLYPWGRVLPHRIDGTPCR